MKNSDLDTQKVKDSRIAMFNAMRDGDETAQGEAFNDFAASLQDAISDDAKKKYWRYQ